MTTLIYASSFALNLVASCSPNVTSSSAPDPHPDRTPLSIMTLTQSESSHSRIFPLHRTRSVHYWTHNGVGGAAVNTPTPHTRQPYICHNAQGAISAPLIVSRPMTPQSGLAESRNQTEFERWRRWCVFHRARCYRRHILLENWPQIARPQHRTDGTSVSSKWSNF